MGEMPFCFICYNCRARLDVRIINRSRLVRDALLFAFIDTGNQGGDTLARSHYQFKKRQKELEKKKKKEEKRQRKLEKTAEKSPENPDPSQEEAVALEE